MAGTKDEGSKVCVQCEQDKPLTAFAPHGTNADGFRNKCRACYAIASKKWREQNERAVKSSRLLREYGVSIEDYERLLAEQDGKCAICFIPKSEAPRGYLAVDHDHETGEVRGLLCTMCNVGLGNFGDEIGRMESALKYLRAKEK